MRILLHRLLLGLGLGVSFLAALPAAAGTISGTLSWSSDGTSQSGNLEKRFTLLQHQTFNLFGTGSTSDQSGFSVTLESFDALGGLQDSVTWNARYCTKSFRGRVRVDGEYFNCPGLELRSPFYLNPSPRLMGFRGRTVVFEEGNAFPTIGRFKFGNGDYRLFVTPTGPASDGQFSYSMAATPLPASAWLLGSALAAWLLGSALAAGLWMRRRRRPA